MEINYNKKNKMARDDSLSLFSNMGCRIIVLSGMGQKKGDMQILNTFMSEKWKEKMEWSFEEGCLLIGAKEMYEAVGEESYFSFIRDRVSGFVKEDGGLADCSMDVPDAEFIHCSRIFFFLYDKTREEKYRRAIESAMGRLGGLSDQTAMEELYKTLPFYMEYETKYGKKERYSDIVRKLGEAEQVLSSGEYNKSDMLWCLFTLMDVIDNMSIEIYEQYRKLQDIFRWILKAVIRETGQGSMLSATERAMTAYCILKACSTGIVLKEKYMDFGLDMMKRLQEEEEGSFGLFRMAYGQYLKLQRESEA